MIETTLIWFLLILVFHTSCYLIGSISNSFFNSIEKCNSFIDHVKKTIIGLIIIIVAYAIIRTNGNTLYIVFIIWFIQLLISRSIKFQKQEIDFKSIFRDYILMSPFFLFILLFLVLIQFYAAEGSGNYKILHFDEVWYSQLSMKIDYFRTESILPISWNDQISRASPYHYFEMWINALFHNLTKINSHLCFSILLKSYLWFLLLLITFGFWKKYNNDKFIALILPLSIFISGIVLGNEEIKQAACNVHQNKITINAIFIALFYFDYLNYRKYSLNWLIVLVILNSSIAPIAFSLSLYEYFKTKNRKILINSLLILFSIALFYFLQSKLLASNSYNYIKNQIYLFNLEYAANLMIKIAKNYILYLIYLIIPLVTILYFYFKKQLAKRNVLIFKHTLIILIISVGAGLISELLFVILFYHDSAQTNVWFTFMFIHLIIISTYLIILRISKSKFFYFLNLVSFVSVLFYSFYIFHETRINMAFTNEGINNPFPKKSNEYKIRISDWLKSQEYNVKGGIFQNLETLKTPNRQSSRGEVMNAYWCNFLVHQNNFIYLISMNSDEFLPVLNDKILNKQNIEKYRDELFWTEQTNYFCSISPLNKYMKDKNLKGENIKLDFITSLNLKFIILEEDAPIDKNVKSKLTLIAKDKISGEEFYSVNFNN